MLCGWHQEQKWGALARWAAESKHRATQVSTCWGTRHHTAHTQAGMHTCGACSCCAGCGCCPSEGVMTLQRSARGGFFLPCRVRPKRLVSCTLNSWCSTGSRAPAHTQKRGSGGAVGWAVQCSGERDASTGLSSIAGTAHMWRTWRSPRMWHSIPDAGQSAVHLLPMVLDSTPMVLDSTKGTRQHQWC